jgi:hypothetical protein
MPVLVVEKLMVAFPAVNADEPELLLELLLSSFLQDVPRSIPAVRIVIREMWRIGVRF